MAKQKHPVVAQIEATYTSHPMPAGAADAIKRQFAALAKKMHKALPDGREKSLVLTKLEEASFFAVAAAARPSADAPAAPAKKAAAATKAPKAKAEAKPRRLVQRATKAA